MPTTPAGLPYPAFGEEPNVPQDLQNLAEALDAAATDTGWVDAVIYGGFEQVPGDYPIRVRRINKIVHLQGLVRPAGGGNCPTADTPMVLVPIGFRPATQHFFRTGANSSTHAGGRAFVTTAGVVQFGGASGATYWTCHTSWMVD